MKHPDCYICKSEISTNAYAYQKHFFCFTHFKQARKGKFNDPITGMVPKSKDVVL